MTVSQAEFTASVLDPARPAPEGVRDGNGAPTTKRFDVYRNNVAVSLTEALIAAFPVIHKLVGDEFFRAMAGVYLRTHQPTSPLMMFYGDKMPQFLKRFQPAQSLPYLPDVARVELAMRQSYHAADARPVSPDVLGQLAPDALMAATIKLAPAVQIVRSAYPIHGIYRANTQADAPAVVNRAEVVLITRPGFDPVLHDITETDADFLDALMAGHAMGVALAKIDGALDLGALLGLLLRQGAMTELN